MVTYRRPIPIHAHRIPNAVVVDCLALLTEDEIARYPLEEAQRLRELGRVLAGEAWARRLLTIPESTPRPEEDR